MSKSNDRTMRRRSSNVTKCAETVNLSYNKKERLYSKQSSVKRSGLLSTYYTKSFVCTTLFCWVLLLLHEHQALEILFFREHARSASLLRGSHYQPAIQFSTDFVSLATEGFYMAEFREFSRARYRNYGDLDISFKGKEKRRIDPNDFDNYEDERAHLLSDYHFRRIDDKNLNDEDLLGEQECYRTNWEKKTLPVCNNFHELSLGRLLGSYQDYDISYLGHGHFRDAWKFEADQVSDSAVMKKFKLNDLFEIKDKYLAQVQKEAIIMESLTGSPRILDIYGLCGLSVLIESAGDISTRYIIGPNGRMKQKELDRIQAKAGDVVPQNKLTPVQKLDWAITMAESIADIHGFKGGVIRHGDIQPDQWLISSTGELKLNDFNVADIFKFNRKEMEYCEIRACNKGTGTYSPPEELLCEDTYEGIDTYRMGNNIYTLLVGLWPFYNDRDRGDHKEDAMNEEIKLKPYLDPRYRNRSMIEGKLVEVMERCWEWYPEKRVSIFEVVKMLREVKRKYENEHSHE